MPKLLDHLQFASNSFLELIFCNFPTFSECSKFYPVCVQIFPWVFLLFQKSAQLYLRSLLTVLTSGTNFVTFYVRFLHYTRLISYVSKQITLSVKKNGHPSKQKY